MSDVKCANCGKWLSEHRVYTGYDVNEKPLPDRYACVDGRLFKPAVTP